MTPEFVASLYDFPVTPCFLMGQLLSGSKKSEYYLCPISNASMPEAFERTVDEHDDDSHLRSRHNFQGCRTNSDVVARVLEGKEHLLGDMAARMIFVHGDGEGGQAPRSNAT